MVAYDRHLYVFGGATGQTLPNDLHWYATSSHGLVLFFSHDTPRVALNRSALNLSFSMEHGTRDGLDMWSIEKLWNPSL